MERANLLGPVFPVEFMLPLRRRRQFLLRLAYAGILLFALWQAFSIIAWQPGTVMTPNRVSALASSFFHTFAMIQLVAVLLIGPAIVAGTIAQERQRRTIEYLFATDLRNSEIVLGKLAARMAQMSLLVLTGLPVVALTMLLGGVAPGLLLQLFIITLSTMVFVGAIAMAVSVYSPRPRDAVSRTFLALFALLVLPWLLMPVLSVMPAALQLVRPDLLAMGQLYNPIFAYWGLAFADMLPVPMPYWQILLLHVGQQALLAALALGLAVFRVRAVHLAAGGTTVATRRRHAQVQRRRPPGDRPVLWKEMHTTNDAGRAALFRKVFFALCMVGAAALSALSFCWELRWAGDGTQYLAYTSTIATIIGCIALLAIGARAATCVTAEKEQQTWDAVLATPMEGREIVSGKILGSMSLLRWLLPGLTILWLPVGYFIPEAPYALPFMLLPYIVCAAFAAALGTFISLQTRSSQRALAITLGAMVFGGGGFMFCCFPAFAMTGEQLFILVLGFCAPFLVNIPAILVGAGLTDFDEMVSSYLVGVVGYSLLAAAFWASSRMQFDQLSGRTYPRHWTEWAPPPPEPDKGRASRPPAGEIRSPTSESPPDD